MMVMKFSVWTIIFQEEKKYCLSPGQPKIRTYQAWYYFSSLSWSGPHLPSCVPRIPGSLCPWSGSDGENKRSWSHKHVRISQSFRHSPVKFMVIQKPILKRKNIGAMLILSVRGHVMMKGNGVPRRCFLTITASMGSKLKWQEYLTLLGREWELMMGG